MTISVLLVMNPERRERLLAQLEACGLDVLAVGNCREAGRVLDTQPAVQVVLTDERLDDGNWLNVLGEIRRNQVEAETIVCSRLGDPRLWIHVLGYGVYDLLTEPWDAREVQRIIEGAAAESWNRSMSLAAVTGALAS